MLVTLPNEFLDVISNNDGLQRYLEQLSIGRKMTPRSWLYEELEPNQVLDRWKERLSTLENGDTFEKKVFQFDISQEAKWGPQGGIAPMSQLLPEIVEPTFAQHSPARAFGSQEWRKAIEQVSYELSHDTKFGKLRPASYKRVIDDMRARDTLESNSGWPDFARRSLPDVRRSAIAAAEDGEWSEYPAIALFRNYNQKTRLVWMFPMAANVFEGSFMQPIQSAIINSGDPFYVPWVGFDGVRDRITQTYDDGKFIYASDFSKTDEHFTWQATREVLKVLKVVFAQSYGKGLEDSLYRMHHIPLIVSDKQMLTGEHGVSSGSNWTNFIETVFDGIFANYVRSATGHSGLYAIGDDMAWVSDNYDDAFSKDLENLGKQVGQQVKADKTTNEPDSVKTLQRLFQRGYSRPDGMLRGVYSTVRALKSSVYPERFHRPEDWSSNMFCARQYMILENCVDHPLFEEFVSFVVKGQKDLIPFARKSRSELNRIHRESKLLPGLNPTYNQEKRDHSLSDFAAIKVARNL
nr:MAG: RNA-dependent RNA-polymerase [Picobirnavirus sp.]